MVPEPEIPRDPDTAALLRYHVARKYWAIAKLAELSIARLAGEPIEEARSRERDGERPYPPGVYLACPRCYDVFDHPVWHCPGCEHHWIVGDDTCRNCHRHERHQDGSVHKVEGRW